MPKQFVVFTADIFTLANGQWTKMETQCTSTPCKYTPGTAHKTTFSLNFFSFTLSLPLRLTLPTKEEINNLTIL